MGLLSHSPDGSQCSVFIIRCYRRVWMHRYERCAVECTLGISIEPQIVIQVGHAGARGRVHCKVQVSVLLRAGMSTFIKIASKSGGKPGST